MTTTNGTALAGTHNLAVLKAGGEDGGLEEEYKNWAWHDARLTETGREQSAALRPKLEGVKIDVVLVSPLSRAIQTAMIAVPPGPKFVVEERVRERNGTHPCDKRRTLTEMHADFPDLDLTPLGGHEEDPTWTPEREPWEKTVARAEEMLQVLKDRPEQSIAIATHNDWLQALLLHSRLQVSDPSLRRKFGNAEWLPLVLTWAPAAGGAATTVSGESTVSVH